MRIAFIGLGLMGLPMATNLVRAGHDVWAYNRSERSFEGTVAGSIAEAVTEADVIITMLPDSPDVEAVVLGDNGVLASAGRGALLIDMSSIAPATARAVATAAAEVGVRALDAPVSGGEQGAIDGALSIMAGGSTDDFEAARIVFEVLGSTVVHVGPAGSGQTVKAANQLIVAGTIGLVAEALTFLAAHSVDLEPAVEVLAGGLAGNRILDRKAAGMIAHTFTPGFRIDLHHKDLGIVIDSARESGTAIPLGAVTAQLMAAARAQGHGSLDHSALLLVIESLSRPA
ncbi:2-hydroxy-3-oxopropionate reductase [Streptomyces sp. SID13031]|uniref:2-hydroxy-3-oxopropionate reductase n=1 Tax=Streptomyces sp. SID13031 TaxID=2706046 RepID=UPI0013CD8EA9|nr:2-hydroxy-3-oxopropionate reductase [Streptomyces sp. SID13031]